MVTNEKYTILQQLVCLSLDHDSDTSALAYVDWKEFLLFAAEQSLLEIWWCGEIAAWDDARETSNAKVFLSGAFSETDVFELRKYVVPPCSIITSIRYFTYAR